MNARMTALVLLSMKARALEPCAAAGKRPAFALDQGKVARFVRVDHDGGIYIIRGRLVLKRALLGLGAAFVLIAAAQASGGPAVVYTVMKDVVAPQADRLWDVGNRGMNDDGEPDASQLSAQDWEKLADAAGKMQAAANSLAITDGLTIVPPGVKIGEDGGATAEQVQQYIARDPAGFARHARELADVSAGYLQAAATRDAVKLAAAAERMDVVCEACHAQYWYPEQ
jgi:hypothetical protein